MRGFVQSVNVSLELPHVKCAGFVGAEVVATASPNGHFPLRPSKALSAVGGVPYAQVEHLLRLKTVLIHELNKTCDGSSGEPCVHERVTGGEGIGHCWGIAKEECGCHYFGLSDGQALAVLGERLPVGWWVRCGGLLRGGGVLG